MIASLPECEVRSACRVQNACLYFLSCSCSKWPLQWLIVCTDGSMNLFKRKSGCHSLQMQDYNDQLIEHSGQIKIAQNRMDNWLPPSTLPAYRAWHHLYTYNFTYNTPWHPSHTCVTPRFLLLHTITNLKAIYSPIIRHIARTQVASTPTYPTGTLYPWDIPTHSHAHTLIHLNVTYIVQIPSQPPRHTPTIVLQYQIL